MKQRETVVLTVRIKKTLFAQINDGVAKSKKPSRNAWMIWAIEQGLRRHKGNGR